jgi:hypothetical protein
LSPDAWPVLDKDMDLARDVGATLLNIHLCSQRGVEAFAEAILPLIHDVREIGLQLSIENTPLLISHEHRLHSERKRRSKPDLDSS